MKALSRLRALAIVLGCTVAILAFGGFMLLLASVAVFGGAGVFMFVFNDPNVMALIFAVPLCIGIAGFALVGMAVLDLIERLADATRSLFAS